MRVSNYKKKIIEICDKNHLTVDEIFDKISKEFPEVGKSSIYRNVEKMVEDGYLNKISGIGKKAYFEKNIGKHIHLIDKDTGKIFDLYEDIKIINIPKNFEINNIDIKIFGNFT